MVSNAAALVADCPSGFVTVMVRVPATALLATETFSVRLVALLTVTLSTVTPPPSTAALRWFEKAGPGSKNPAPPAPEPLITSVTLATPWVTVEGEQLSGVAGAGASNLITWTPQESFALQYSCTVHSVMSSAGSTV